MKKYAALILALLLISYIIPSCSSRSSGTEATGDDTEAGSPNAHVKASVTLRFLTSSNASWPYDPDWYVYKALEEASGVHLEITTGIGSDYNNKFVLTLASGDVPDLMFINDPNIRNKYALAGAFINISNYLDKGALPNLAAIYSKNRDSKAWFGRFSSADGSLYCFPNYGYGDQNRIGWYYREDILRDNGLRVPENYDELYQVCKALKQRYPDSYPFSLRLLTAPTYGGRMDMMATQWSSGSPYYFDPDAGEWRFGPETGGYEALVVWLNKMYAEKLIPPDVFTLSTQQWEQMISTGKSFITMDYLTRIDIFNNVFKASGIQGDMRFMPPPAGMVDGFRKNQYSAFGDASFVIPSTSKKIADALKYCDWMYTDEAREIATWGGEGATYRVVDGKRVWIKPAGREGDGINKLYGLGTEGAFLLIDGAAAAAVDKTQQYVEALKESAKYDDAPIPLPAFNEEESNINGMARATILNKLNEGLAEFVTGQRNINEWDKFTGELDALGAGKMVKIYNDAYKRVNN